MPDPRDYKELTELAQDLARIQQQASRANIEADRELLSLEMDRAKVIRGYTDEQRDFVREHGAQQLHISKENLEIEQKVLRTRMHQSLKTGEDTTALERRLEQNRAILDLTDQGIDSLQEQASWMGKQEGSMFEIEDLNKRILVLRIEHETLSQNILGLSEAELAVYKDQIETLIARAELQKGTAELETKRRQEQERGSKVFGITSDMVRDKAKDISALLTNWPVLLGATLTVGLRTFETLRKEAQLGIGQTFSLVNEGISGWAKSLSTGVVVTTEEAASAVAALATEFGRTDLITGDLIKKQIRLTTIYGMQGEQSAELLELLEIVGHHSEQFTSSSLQFMENLARANDIPIGALMSDVAFSASSFAISSEESLNNLIRSVAEAKRLGLDINKVVSFAESSVMNPDNFIQNVARLRQFGFQIADPIGLMAIANDPARQEELVDEIVKTFTSTGRDLASITRVERQLLEQTFGMDFEEIRKVAARAGGAGALRPAEAGAISRGRDVAQNLAASTLRFVRDVDMAGFALNALAAAAVIKGVGGIGGGLAGLFRGGAGAAGLAAKVLPAAGALGAGIEGALNVADIVKGGGARTRGLFGLGAGAVGAGIGTLIAPGVGTLIGAGIGSAIGRAVAPKATAAVAGAGAVAEQHAMAARGAEQIIVLDTTRLEDKVDQLIVAVRTAPPIQMDTTRVTTALRRGEPRMTNTAA